MPSSKVSSDRQVLVDAQEKGGLAVPFAFLRLSGPGWLQSAITLGGGSLTGALFLGVLGGTSMLWLQLMAIIMGVIMLSAISYVTLSTGKRPFQAINEYVNPVLGCGWLLATCAANIIWCMPQFSLSFAALDKNLFHLTENLEPGSDQELYTKLTVSGILLALAFVLVVFNERKGLTAKIFDIFLKCLVATIVICFFGVVIYLINSEGLKWGEILSGFIPNWRQWIEPTGAVKELVETAPDAYQGFWSNLIVKNQRDVMIGAAATAVGINMTFLLPYSMLSRGWDRPFRGLARFDLATGMAIPYILVTTCVVIAASHVFHAQADPELVSSDPRVMMESPLYKDASKQMQLRIQKELGLDAAEGASEQEYENWVASVTADGAAAEKLDPEVEKNAEQLQEMFADQLGADAWSKMSPDMQRSAMAALPEVEKKLAASLVKRNAFQLSESLVPLLGEKWANVIFGIGVLGMGFSTIIILMLINGYVFSELAPEALKRPAHYLGCLVAGGMGFCWPYVWTGDSLFWLAIFTSTFGMMLLPIAYITFFFMMNNEKLLGEHKPRGASMVIWNILMLFSVLGAIIAAGSAVWTKMGDPKAGPIIAGVAIFFGLMAIAGFAATPSRQRQGE